MPTVTVSHLLRADLDAAADTMADAFTDDPWFAWLYRDVETDAQVRRGLLVAFMATVGDHAIDAGHSYTLADHAAVALWRAPDHRSRDAEDRAVRELLIGQGVDMDRVVPGFRRILGARPSAPHFYLDTLATRPATQGRGLGSQLIGHVLAECDRQGLPAFLESSNPRNVSLYLRHGFQPQGRIDMPDDPSVHLTPMWREPAPPDRGGAR